MHRIALIATFWICVLPAKAQQFLTREGVVRFFSSTPIEDIKAENHQVTALITADGAFAFRVPILGFRFEKALMEEHFNENYMESHAHPNASFEGAVAGFSAVPKDGDVHRVVAEGKFTVHGIEQQRAIPSNVRWNGIAWEVTSTFQVDLEDHEIAVPKVVRNKIAESIEVTFTATLRSR